MLSAPGQRFPRSGSRHSRLAGADLIAGRPGLRTEGLGDVVTLLGLLPAARIG